MTSTSNPVTDPAAPSSTGTPGNATNEASRGGGGDDNTTTILLAVIVPVAGVLLIVIVVIVAMRAGRYDAARALPAPVYTRSHVWRCVCLELE